MQRPGQAASHQPESGFLGEYDDRRCHRGHRVCAVTYQGRGHWLEVYGDRGTLVLGSDNQKDYVHGFRLWSSLAGQPLTELEIPKFPQTYADGRLAPFIRVVGQNG